MLFLRFPLVLLPTEEFQIKAVVVPKYPTVILDGILQVRLPIVLTPDQLEIQKEVDGSEWYFILFFLQSASRCVLKTTYGIDVATPAEYVRFLLDSEFSIT